MGFLDPLEAGAKIDSYCIEAPVARSGMASIYRAVDTRDNRIVALKIPHPDMEADPILFDRFQRESAIGEKLDHPRIMRVFGGWMSAHPFPQFSIYSILKPFYA